jgi:hypothetical protein
VCTVLLFHRVTYASSMNKFASPRVASHDAKIRIAAVQVRQP